MTDHTLSDDEPLELTVRGVPGPRQSRPSATAAAVDGAIFQEDTGTLIGTDEDVPSSRSNLGRQRANPDELLILRNYQLKAQGQRHQHVMQAWVLLGILFVIMTTLILSIVAVGVRWITEEFAQQVLSLILTAALSGLGGAVAWAFRGVSPPNNGEQETSQR